MLVSEISKSSSMAGAKERYSVQGTKKECGRLSRTRIKMDVTRENKKRNENVPGLSRMMATVIEKET